VQLDEALGLLRAKAAPNIRAIFQRHGAPDNVLGVKVGDLKVVLKEAGKDDALARALWDSGVGDARYLAGLMIDPKKMDAALIQRWADEADWTMLSESTVPWVAAESPHGLALARRWVDDPRPAVAAAGWATWSCLVSMLPDAGLPLDELRALLDRVATGVHHAPNRVRYCQNSFVISVGVYVAPLRDAALAVADQIGPVHVDMGETACDVPLARPYVEKSLARGEPKKKKTVRC
jgi:3-methyladenine DNA glycosylase AlkD